MLKLTQTRPPWMAGLVELHSCPAFPWSIWTQRNGIYSPRREAHQGFGPTFKSELSGPSSGVELCPAELTLHPWRDWDSRMPPGPHQAKNNPPEQRAAEQLLRDVSVLSSWPTSFQGCHTARPVWIPSPAPGVSIPSCAQAMNNCLVMYVQGGRVGWKKPLVGACLELAVNTYPTEMRFGSREEKFWKILSGS